ncbi:NF038122 family metalloprotease [Bradyrhizobium sp. HKCCYLS3077]|uniref:NF038122 family metalloprotease n=1 Tax=unclassified Bradyrhizobium TaxID=2631580 RepID=UPI003EC0527E
MSASLQGSPNTTQAGDERTPPSTPIELPEEAVESLLAQGDFAGVGAITSVTAGGLTINLLFDTAAMNAPASFRAGIQQAAAILTSAISDHITVNLKIDYSGTGGGAAAGPDNGQWMSYSSVRSNLITNASPGDTTFNALPTGSSIQGQSYVAVWNSQLKLWGGLSANDATTDDGSATFATDINPNLLVGVALHELTHAFGRVPYGPQPDVFDLFRFSSPGVRLMTGGATASTAYFSVDGGYTKLGDYGQSSDPSDFLNSGVQGANDPFNEFYTYNTLQTLTSIDLKQMVALGFHLIGSSGTVIRTNGDTSLTQVGSSYYLNSVSGGVGPVLKYAGAAVLAGQFGSIAPIGAVKTAAGYDVAWQIPSTNQFTFWTTDNNGNYTSNLSGIVSGNSITSEALETTFGQDFNNDGTIGVTAALVHANGGTSLLQIADGFYMYVNGSGPQLKYAGSPFTVGQFGTIAPIAAVQVGNGFDVAWKDSATNRFTFWTTDKDGNYTGNLTGLVSAGSFATESMETTFGQDFNGDGTIGVTAALVRTNGSTNLLHIADTYYIYVNGSGPQLKYAGSPVTDGIFGTITPIGAIQTATGFDVAWKIPGTSQFTFWAIDSNGNYSSNLSGLVDGTSASVKSFELIFQQDLNGDSIIGPPSSTSLAASPSAIQTAASGPSAGHALEISGTFSGELIGYGSTADQIKISSLAFASLRSVYDDQSGQLSLNDGTSSAVLHFAGPELHDGFHFAADSNGGVLISGVNAPPAATGQPVSLQGHDAFVFAEHFGNVSVSGFTPGTDKIVFNQGIFADQAALQAAIHDDAAGNAVITDAAQDTITIQHVSTAELLSHLSTFHLV